MPVQRRRSVLARFLAVAVALIAVNVSLSAHGVKWNSTAVAAGQITLSPNPLFICVGGTGHFTGTHGSFTESASGYDPTLIQAPTSSGTNPTNWTVRGQSGKTGTTTIHVTDTQGAAGDEVVNLNGPMTASQASVTFDGTTGTPTPAPITITDTGPSTTITVTSSDSTNSIATISPTTAATNAVTGQAQFTITPVASNSSSSSVTFTFKDSSNTSCPSQTQTVTATVKPGPLAVSTPSVNISGIGSTTTFTGSERLYSGNINATSGNPAVATVQPTSAPGPGPDTFTVTSKGFGQTNIAVTDNHSGTQNVAVLVSGASISISGSSTATFNAPDNSNAHLPASAVRVTGAMETTATGNAQIYVSSPSSISGTHGGSIPIARLTYNCTGNGSGNNQGATFATGFLQLVVGAGPNCMTFPASQFSNLDFNLNLFLDDRSMPADTYTSTNGFSVVLSAT